MSRQHYQTGSKFAVETEEFWSKRNLEARLKIVLQWTERVRKRETTLEDLRFGILKSNVTFLVEEIGRLNDDIDKLLLRIATYTVPCFSKVEQDMSSSHSNTLGANEECIPLVDVAKLLHVHTNYVYKLSKRLKWPRFKLNNQRILVYIKDVVKYMKDEGLLIPEGLELSHVE